MKIGLDFHGVLDSNIEFFKLFTSSMTKSNNEIHIITGMKKEAVKEFCEEHNISYHKIYSIMDDFLSRNKSLVVYVDDKPFFPDILWDKAKANYCAKNEIDLMIDDSDEYCKYFTTPYVKWKS